MQSAVQLGTLKKFQETPGRFQRTFHTPLKTLPSFVTAILSAFDEVHSGTLTIDEVVFQPTALEALLSRNGLPVDLPCDTSIIAENDAEIESLLVAAFSEWVDFLFVSLPESFVLYADHDEYATFFAASQSKLSALEAMLTKHGFTAIENYTRNV